MLAILIRCYNKQIFKAGILELFPPRGYINNLFKPLLSDLTGWKISSPRAWLTELQRTNTFATHFLINLGYFFKN